MCSFIAEIFKEGCWRQLDGLQDKELVRLRDNLQVSLADARASSTSTKYANAFLRWKRWGELQPDIWVLPVDPQHLCLYLQHLKETSASRSAIAEAVNAVTWAHQLAGLEDVSKHPLVVAMTAALQRCLAKPVVKKEPITPDMLQQLVQSIGLEPSLLDLRTCAVCLLAFAGFLWIDELLKVALQ